MLRHVVIVGAGNLWGLPGLLPFEYVYIHKYIYYEWQQPVLNPNGTDVNDNLKEIRMNPSNVKEEPTSETTW